jgi:hypothetical protein
MRTITLAVMMPSPDYSLQLLVFGNLRFLVLGLKTKVDNCALHQNSVSRPRMVLIARNVR